MSVIEDFLSKLGANTKITVGVSVSPVVGLEMIEMDRVTGTVNKYAHKPLEYNQSAREINDYTQFEMALEELFEELHIPKSSNIILNLPNVHFGIINLPLLLNDEAITNSILSEVEQSYIFKRQEPVISWAEASTNVNTENRTLVYSAIQETALHEIRDVCDNIGCSLVGLETSYPALLRALNYTNLAEEQMKEGIAWNLMLVGQNSYSILSMLDKRILDYYEEPLALKSFVGNEIYNAITTSAQLTLASLPVNHLYVISETDLVSAEVLSMKIQFEGKITYLECNKYTQNPLLPTNLNILPKTVLQISPEVIGSVVYPFSNLPLKMNLIKDKEMELFGAERETFPKINIGNLEVELTPNFVKILCILVGSIFILPLLLASITLSAFVLPKEQNKLNVLNREITQTQEQINQYTAAAKNNTFNLRSVVDGIVTKNKQNLVFYSAVGASVPNKVWITYYVTNEVGKIDIKGKASNVQSVYDFYKNFKQIVSVPDIKLYKLEISSGSIEDVIGDFSVPSKAYDFEITNMSEAELNPSATPAPNPAAGDAPPQPGVQTPAPATRPEEPKPISPLNPLFGRPGQNQPQPGAAPNAPQLPQNLQKIEHF